MVLHLVGETIDAKRAHLAAHAGELIPIMRGIYVGSKDDIEAAILGQAVRIAHYLYPKAYLSGASAHLLGPTPDGRLFISGRRNQRTRLRTLEIVQNQAPAYPSTASAVVGDDAGELRIDVATPRQRFLEAFRLRSENANAVTREMRVQMGKRLIDEYGSPQASADSIWELARKNAWYREGEKAERFLLAPRHLSQPPLNKAAFELLVAWHGDIIGRLAHDGFEWRWRPQKYGGPIIVRETAPGKLPAFIDSLLPEGWLARVLHESDERRVLRSGRRYMSNIAIADSREELMRQPADVLTTPLIACTEGGRFTGHYQGPARGEIEETFEQNLARIATCAETPRLSGVQIKMPMSLLDDCTVAPAIGMPFTHIFKPAGTGGFEGLPVIEWLCLELGRAVGFDVPPTALIEMPNGIPPALLVERFDIRQGHEDRRRFALEDFCSILDLSAAAKYDGTIERVARGLRPLSTDPAMDLNILFRRAVFAWLIADGDMHLKNVAMLKTAEAEAKVFASVRFAPLYDTVTTQVFPGLAGDRMALELSDKDDRLTKEDFINLGRVIGLAAGQVEAILTQLAWRVAESIANLRLPEFADRLETVQPMRRRMVEIATIRSNRLLG
jgi:serine/threonine-protein kinase HipA